MKYFLIIYLLASITTHSLQTDIGNLITYHTKEAYRQNMLGEILAVENQWNITGTTGDLKPFGYNTTWWFKGSSITVKDLQITTVLLDLRKLEDISIKTFDDSFKIILSGYEVFNLQLSFNYEYNCYTSGKGKGIATIRTNSTSFEKIHQLKTENETERTYSEFELKFTEVNQIKFTEGDYIGDVYVEDMAKKAFLDRIINSPDFQFLNDKFEAEFNKYYELPSKKAIFLEMAMPPMKLGVEFFNIGFPHVAKDESVITYYTSLVVDVNSQSRNLNSNNNEFTTINNNKLNKLTNKLNNNFNFNKFTNVPGESFQMFLSGDILNEILTRASSQARMEFTLFDVDIPLVLDIETLSTFYPAIIGTRPSDELIRVNGFINNFALIPTDSTINGHFTIQFKIFSATNDELVFEFSSLITVEALHSITTTGLNFKIGQANVSSSTVPYTYGVINQAILNKYVSDTLEYLNNKFEFLLFKAGFDLNDIFKTIKSVELISNEGLLIIGEPIRYVEESSNNVKMSFSHSTNSLYSKNLKFLN